MDNDTKITLMVMMMDDLHNRILGLQQISEMTAELISLMAARIALLEKERNPLVQSENKETIQ